MKVLVLSAYDAGSHKRWRQTLERGMPEIQWTVLTLPPRHFSWRVRSNPLTWSLAHRATLEASYDLVLATSMVDVSTLRGLVPALGQVPWITYWHENQFAYPQRDLSYNHSPSLLILQIYNALGSDHLVFNSEFNRNSFFEGVPRFLKKMPDGVPEGLLETLRERSEVLPVPIDDAWYTGRDSARSGPLSILWNHRWEYDKAPERFAEALRILHAMNVDFVVSLVGQAFRKIPESFESIQEEFGGRFRHFGFIEDAAVYQEILRTSDVVVSTALHEFQGLSVLEAVASGCYPVVPDRLAYPEYFSSQFRYNSSIDDPICEAQNLARILENLSSDSAMLRVEIHPELEKLRWTAMKSRYVALFERALGK